MNTHLSNTFKPPDPAGGAIGDFKVKHSVFDPKASIKSEGRHALGRVFCCMKETRWRLPSGRDKHMNASKGNLCRVSTAGNLRGCLTQDLPLETRTLKATETPEFM